MHPCKDLTCNVSTARPLILADDFVAIQKNKVLRIIN
jgi:hypothetical protein